MNVFGSTRSTVRSDHALIAPDSFVRSALPGWDGTEGGQPAVYILPTYRFQAQVEGQPSYDVELLALDPAGFTIAAPTPQPAPAPEPAPPPEPAPAPKPAVG